jgi:predicted ester cyclase
MTKPYESKALLSLRRRCARSKIFTVRSPIRTLLCLTRPARRTGRTFLCFRGRGPGPQGLKDLIPMFLKAFPDMKIVIHEIVGSTGRAGVRASIVGTQRGDLFGVPPTGKPVDVALHEFHHLENGRITHTWHLEDWFGMLNKIGAWPPSSGNTNEGGEKK